MNELTTEQVFDILPDVVTVYEKTGIKAYRERLQKENAGKKKGEIDAMGLGIGLVLHILKNSKKVKPEIFEIISTVESITIDEAKQLSPFKTFEILKAILTNKEATQLFKSAVQ